MTTYTVVVTYNCPTLKPLTISISNPYETAVNEAATMYSKEIRRMMTQRGDTKEVQLWRNDHMLASMLY